jgi:tetratricopeptide (TPR) repeat protein
MIFSFKLIQYQILGVISLFFFIQVDLCAQLTAEQSDLIQQYDKKIKELKAANQFKEAATLLNKRAFVYIGAGRYEEGIGSYLESAEINTKIGNDADNKKIFNNIAMIYAEMGQMGNSIKYFERSLLISRRNNNKNEVAVSLMDISTILFYNKQYDDAIRYLEEALKISHDLDNLNSLISCYNLLSQVHRAKGNTSVADEYHNQYLVLDQMRKDGKNYLENKSDAFISSKGTFIGKDQADSFAANSSKTLNDKFVLEKKPQTNQELLSDYEKIEIARKEAEKEIKKMAEDRHKRDAEIVRIKDETEQKIMYLLIAGIFIISALTGTGIYLLARKQQHINSLKEQLSSYKNLKNE